jgi:hypothetical protein
MEQGIRLRVIVLQCFIITVLSPQLLNAQLNPVNNLQWEHWYIQPYNYFDLWWEQPDSTLDTLVGYNIYRESELYRFQIETSLYNTPAHSNCGEDFLDYGGGGFWIHVNAVYNSTLEESNYVDSIYCYGLAVGIEENYYQAFIAYPNPFTTSTTIEYELTEPTHVHLTIYNSIGEMVYMAEDRIMPQGTHQFTWSPYHLPIGLYFAVLRSEEGVSVVKMVKQ